MLLVKFLEGYRCYWFQTVDPRLQNTASLLFPVFEGAAVSCEMIIGLRQFKRGDPQEYPRLCSWFAQDPHRSQVCLCC
ncbi:hypothetical protein JTE90_029220 [Oedothorax gibbosus]|uniref:Uncharacterized protein n=1 Tax=Oedothorax gibbosus TaxID=931172 RepID=A0AAV6VEA6_9ARAC|nr:hypothetical protein JTE90_029220 [Oedothorax gibbosus]